MSNSDSGQQPLPQPKFDPNAPNQQKPRLRPIRGFAAKQGEQVLLGLADAQQISDKIVLTTPAAQAILPLMTGENDLDTIVKQVGRGLTRPWLEQFVAQLDDAALIEGPRFVEMQRKMREEFDSSTHLPPASTAQMADMLVAAEKGGEATDEEKKAGGADALRRQMDKWIADALADAQDPSFDALPKAIVAPHLDYPRGWLNYASVYGRLRVVDRPDRIVILGTNHFGFATGVCGCDKGFETPLGVSPVDTALVSELKARLGEENSRKLFEHRYDHEREHSIELQAAWIQHVFGGEDGTQPPVFAALVHDPSRGAGDGASYDGRGLDLLTFIDAMKSAIAAMPGRTLVVSSADLSHVGPQFGDQVQLLGDEEAAQQNRNRVLQHDREMLELFAQGKPEELVTSMAWQQNPTRWCSIGNMVAAMKIVGGGEVRVLNYTAAIDQQGMALVSSCAAAIF